MATKLRCSLCIVFHLLSTTATTAHSVLNTGLFVGTGLFLPIFLTGEVWKLLKAEADEPPAAAARPVSVSASIKPAFAAAASATPTPAPVPAGDGKDNKDASYTRADVCEVSVVWQLYQLQLGGICHLFC